MSSRSTAAEVRRRNEEAARLLSKGFPRSEVVSLLAEQCKVDRRTAHRYVVAGADILAAEVDRGDLRESIMGTVDALRSIAARALQDGMTTEAINALGKAGVIQSSIFRTENGNAMAMHGRTLAMPEFPPDKLRRKYREPITDPAMEAPF
jgi:hypothetical protein